MLISVILRRAPVGILQDVERSTLSTRLRVGFLVLAVLVFAVTICHTFVGLRQVVIAGLHRLKL